MSTASPHIVDRLVRDNMPLARSLARRMKRAMPPQVDIDELEADAYLGLFKAAKAFDDARGFLFSTYATRRIVGEMIDGVRERSQFRKRGKPVRIGSLDAPVYVDDGQAMTRAGLVPSRERAVGDSVDDQDEIDFLLGRMKGKSRRTVEDVYLRGLTMDEVGAQEGVTGSAVALRMQAVRAFARELLASQN